MDLASFLEPVVGPAPALELTGPNGLPASLAALRGVPVLVFFGYTHCPDVCPATIGAVGQAIDAYGKDARAVFVSVDPERDTIPWLAEFVRFMPTGFTAITGTPAEVKAAADDWGVRYAKVEEADPAAYSMSHTADVFLVDAAGQLRARFPFGTEPETMTAVLRDVAATTPGTAPSSAAPSPAPAIAPSTAPTAIDLWPRVVSSSVWAGGASPVILSLFDGAGKRVDDPGLRVTAQLLDANGAPVGPAGYRDRGHARGRHRPSRMSRPWTSRPRAAGRSPSRLSGRTARRATASPWSMPSTRADPRRSASRHRPSARRRQPTSVAT